MLVCDLLPRFERSTSASASGVKFLRHRLHYRTDWLCADNVIAVSVSRDGASVLVPRCDRRPTRRGAEGSGPPLPRE